MVCRHRIAEPNVARNFDFPAIMASEGWERQMFQNWEAGVPF
jgi:hypothetical protein